MDYNTTPSTLIDPYKIYPYVQLSLSLYLPKIYEFVGNVNSEGLYSHFRNESSTTGVYDSAVSVFYGEDNNKSNIYL